MALRPPSLPDPGGKKLDSKVGGIFPLSSMGLAYLPTFGWFLTVKYGKCR